MSGQPPRPGPVCGKHLAAITLHGEPGGGAEFLRLPGPENKQDGTCAAEEHLPQHRHRAAGRRRTSASLRGRGARSGAKAAGGPGSAAGPPAVLWHCGVRTRRPPCGPRQGPSWAAGAGPVGRSPAERRHSTWRQPLLTGRGRRGTHGASASGPSSGTLRGSPGLLRAASGANLTAGPDAKLGGSCSPALPNSQQGRGRVDAWGALRSRDLSGMWKTHLKSTGTAVKWPSGKAAWSRTQRRRPLPQCSGVSPGGEDGAAGYLGESYCPVSAC